MEGSYSKGHIRRFAKLSDVLVSIRPLHWSFPIPSLQEKTHKWMAIQHLKRLFTLTVMLGWEALGWSDWTRMLLLSCTCVHISGSGTWLIQNTLSTVTIKQHQKMFILLPTNWQKCCHSYLLTNTWHSPLLASSATSLLCVSQCSIVLVLLN